MHFPLTAQYPDLESQPYEDAHPRYIPSEMVGSFCPDDDAHTLYYCYLLELKQEFEYEIPVHDILLGTRNELEFDGGNTHFDLNVGSGSLIANLKYVGVKNVSPEEVRPYPLMLMHVPEAEDRLMISLICKQYVC